MRTKFFLLIIVIIFVESSCNNINKFSLACDFWGKGLEPYNKGLAKLQDKDTAGSIKFFNDALPNFIKASNTDTSNSYYRRLVADCLYYTRRYHSAALVYHRVFSNQPELTSSEERESYCKWAKAENNIGNYKKANEMNQRVVKIQEDLDYSNKLKSESYANESENQHYKSSSSYDNTYSSSKSSYESKSYKSTYHPTYRPTNTYRPRTRYK
ncbi:MAG: hypothetical protein WCP69_00410 [Bacteroidota bacterium]